MIAVIDDANKLIYIGESIEEIPGGLLEKDQWGNKSVYRHIEVRERPQGMILEWNDKLQVFEDKAVRPQLSIDPSTDGSATLMKENENLKQRLIEQERQLNLIRSHLGL